MKRFHENTTVNSITFPDRRLRLENNKVTILAVFESIFLQISVTFPSPIPNALHFLFL